jgi:hypothetical protein
MKVETGSPMTASTAIAIISGARDLQDSLRYVNVQAGLSGR